MQKDNPEPVNHHDIIIKYSIISSLAPLENERYKQEISGEISLVNDDNEDGFIIGHVWADKLLMDIAINEGEDLYPVCNISQTLMDIGQVVYDFKNDDWHPLLYKKFGFNLIERNLLILNSVEILPEYDSLDIGKYVIKDLYNNFIQGASLFVIIGFPLHSLETSNEAQPEWKLNTRARWKMVKTYPKLFQSLVKFYTGIGFKYNAKVASDLMFMSAEQLNSGFDKIVLD